MEAPELIFGDVAVDDRGCVSFVNDFKFEGVKRFYMVENHHKGFVRAWHGHEREGKYILVVQGTALVGVVSLIAGPKAKPYRYVLSARKPQILWIPPGNSNGIMNLEADTKVMVFSSATLEESKGDDIRWPWDKFGAQFWEVEFR